MNVFFPRLLSRGEDFFDLQVAILVFGSSPPIYCGANPALLGKSVRVPIHGYRRKPQRPTRLRDSDRNLSAIGDQNGSPFLHSGIFPCFLDGPRSRLPESVFKLRMRVRLVSSGTITSSMYPSSAAL